MLFPGVAALDDDPSVALPYVPIPGPTPTVPHDRTPPPAYPLGPDREVPSVPGTQPGRSETEPIEVRERPSGGSEDATAASTAPAQPAPKAEDGPSAALFDQAGPAAAGAGAPSPVPDDGRSIARIAGGLLFLGWLGFRMVPIVGGSRLERETVRDHPVRRHILEHLERHPGETTMGIADAANIGCGRATYHLSILVREQFVRVRRIDGRRRFFPTGAPKVPDEEVLLRELTQPARSTGRIVRILGRSPGTTLSELSRLLGMSPGQAHYHVAKLDEVGLLYRVKRGRRVRHYLTAAGHSVSVRGHHAAEPGGGPVAA